MKKEIKEALERNKKFRFKLEKEYGFNKRQSRRVALLLEGISPEDI